MSLRGYPLLACALAAFELTASLASAEERPLLERAQLAADRAEFREAHLLLEELPEELGLTTDELRTALILRANLAYALDDVESMEHDMALLARFTAPNQLPEDLPPLLRERFEVQRGGLAPVSLQLDHAVEAGQVRVTLRGSAPDQLVRRVRLMTRSAGHPEWREQPVEGEVIELGDAEGLRFYAELIGAGGAVLARQGSRDEPLTPRASRRRVRAWPFALVAVAVAVALGVGLGLGLRADDDISVQVGAPVVSW